MQIDYYCFVMERFGQVDYSQMKQKYKSCFFDNLEFDMTVAKRLGKFAVYCKEKDAFYDEHWKELNVSHKVLFPRCIISDTNFLFTNMFRVGAIPFYTIEDYKKSEEWYKYIKPRDRKVVLTSYGEFVKNFKLYEKEFGRVFFKTAKKNISCEVKGVMDLGDMFFSEILSDDDIAETPSRYDDVPKREPMYAVFTNQSKGSNDHRFNWLKMHEPVLIEPFLTLKKDNRYANVPVEYRSFVVDGKFVTSRSWVPSNEKVPEEVKNITKQVIEAMQDDMQKTFVVDVLEYVDELGHSHFDLCEINPITSSGYEQGSSIFLLEEGLADEKFYPKYDLISECQSE